MTKFTASLAGVLLASTLWGCAGSNVSSNPSRAGVSSKGPRIDVAALTALSEKLAEERDIAAEHIGFALRKADDLAWMHRHVRHARHALDPSLEPDGPGLNLGLFTGAKQALARDRNKDPRKRQRLGAARPMFETVERRAGELLTLAQNVLNEKKDATRASLWIASIQAKLVAIRDGVDANGDGTMSPNESGLGDLHRELKARGRSGN